MTYSGDFESQEQEDYYHQQWLEQQQEPDVVPCFECGAQMYQSSNVPKLNICEACSKEIQAIEEKF